MSGLEGLSLDQLRAAVNNAARQAQYLQRASSTFETASQNLYQAGSGVVTARNAGMGGWQGRAATAADGAMHQVVTTTAASQEAADNSNYVAANVALNTEETKAAVAAIPNVDTSWGGAFSRNPLNPIAAVGDHHARVVEADQNRTQALQQATELNEVADASKSQLGSSGWPTVPDPGNVSKPPATLPSRPSSSGSTGGYGSGGGGGTTTVGGESTTPYPYLTTSGGGGDISSTEPAGGGSGRFMLDPGGSTGTRKVEEPTDPHAPGGGKNPVTPVEPGPAGPGGPGPVSPPAGGPTAPTGWVPGPEPIPGQPIPGGPTGGDPVPQPTPAPYPTGPVVPVGPGGIGSGGPGVGAPGGASGGAPDEGPGSTGGTGGAGAPGEGGTGGAGEGEGGLRGGLGRGLGGGGGGGSEEYSRGGFTDDGYGHGIRGTSATPLDEGSPGALGGGYDEALPGGGLSAGAGGMAADEAGSRGMFGPGLGRGARRDDDEEYAVPDYLQESSSVWGGDQLAAPSVIGE